MTQLGEAVAKAAFSSDMSVCPMEPHKKAKTLTGKAKEVKSVPELRRSMIAGKSTRQWRQNGDDFELAEHHDTQQKPPPEYDQQPIEIAEVTYPLSISAHHLIPGKASLPVSTVKKYVWKSEGVIDGDIGYDVDGAENGKWLPTHQIMSSRMGDAQTVVIVDDTNPSRTRGMSWAELSDRAKEKEGSQQTYTELFLPRYTQQAMKLLNCQFHDGHDDYSRWVKGQLDKISLSIDLKSGFCDKCKENAIKTPPYLLVYRLNRFSRTCAGLLSGSPTNSWSRIYTSEFAAMYQRTPLPDNMLGK